MDICVCPFQYIIFSTEIVTDQKKTCISNLFCITVTQMEITFNNGPFKMKECQESSSYIEKKSAKERDARFCQGSDNILLFKTFKSLLYIFIKYYLSII